MKKIILCVLSLLVLPAVSLAGESGYIFQGKEYVVFKDGEKVGKTFAEANGSVLNFV